MYGRVSQWADGSLPSLRAGNVVIVAHGGSIRMLRAHLSGVNLDGMAWGEVSNASIIDVTPSKSLMSANPL
jgi:broad specificity phosphatase PhoE